MKKKIAWLIMEVIFGAILIGIGLTIHIDYYSNMIFAMGCGLGFGASAQIVRIMYWRSPKHLDEYEARRKEAHINIVDERKQYLRMKTGHITCQIMGVALLLLAFGLSIFCAEVWTIVMISLLFLGGCVVWTAIFRMLEKKM